MANRISKPALNVAPFSEQGLRNILEGLKPGRELVLPPWELQEILGVRPASELTIYKAEEARLEIAQGLADFWKEAVRVSLSRGNPKPRLWVEALIPVAWYLYPIIDKEVDKRLARGLPWERRDVVESCLKNTKWVIEWVGDDEVVREVMAFVMERGEIPDGTFDNWRKAGIARLWTELALAARGEPGRADIARQVMQRRERAGAVVEDDEPAARLYFVPPLPVDYIEPGVQQTLIEQLTATTGSGEAVCNGVILYGTSGMGKTTLTIAVARAEAVGQAFECILWMNAAEDRLDEWLERVCNALKVRQPWGVRPQDCWRNWIADRRFLLVVDDVVDGAVLKSLLEGMSHQAVVLVITHDADSVREALFERVQIQKLKMLRVGGLEPERARVFVEQRLGRALTDQEWEVLREIGERISWLPGPLRLLATEEDARELWPGVLESLRAGHLPLDEIKTRLEKRMWERLAQDKRQWLASLVEPMKYGGSFGDMYGAWAWNVSPAEAARRLHMLERASGIEAVSGQAVGLGLDRARWRVPSVVYRFLCERQRRAGWSRKWFQVQRMARAVWQSGRAYSLSLPPTSRAFMAVTIVWLLLFTPIKVGVELGLGLVELLIGRRGWRERWRMWTVAVMADEHLRVQWARSGQAPTEDFGLVYDARLGRAIWLLVLAYAMWIGMNPLAAVWSQSEVMFMSGVGLNLGVLVMGLYSIAHIAWRVWLAYLCGVETWDLRMIAALARRLGMRAPGHQG